MAPSLLPITSTRLGRTAVEDTILPFKTSAVFLASLGNNLRLDTSSPLPSPRLTPSPETLRRSNSVLDGLSLSKSLLGSSDSKTKASLQSSPLAQVEPRSSSGPPAPTSNIPLGQHRRRNSPSHHEKIIGIQPLTQTQTHNVHIATDAATRTEAQELLAISVASQRTLAFRSLASHPVNITLFALVLFLVERCIRITCKAKTKRNIPISPSPFLSPWTCIIFSWLTTSAIAAAVLLVLVWLPYRTRSRQITDTWLKNDEVLVVQDASNNNKVAGTLLLSYRVREAQLSRCKRRKLGRGFIRGWAVDPDYQSEGIGFALLSEAARIVSARGGEGLWFAEDHAHSQRALPACYSALFERRDRLARLRLEEVVEMQSLVRKR